MSDGILGASQERKPRPKHPTGFEPGAHLGDDDTGVLVAQPRPIGEGEHADPAAEPWDHHIRRAGLNPDDVEVQEPIEIRTWDAAIGNGQTQTMVYFRARLVTRQRRILDAQLRDWVNRWKPLKRSRPSGPHTFVVAWADTQVGKDEGGGTPKTVERWMNSHGQVQDRLRDLRKLGVDVGHIVVPILGDMVEGCNGHYAQQTYRVDANYRRQRRVVVDCAKVGLKTFSDLAEHVTVLPVGGNHGEVRDGAGKSFTDFADNVDVAAIEDVAHLLAENPDRFGNVRFHVPWADLTQVIDVDGTFVGLAHGHQAGRSTAGSPETKIMKWWRGQMDGRQPVGDADILLTGHYHHARLVQNGARTWMQAPALDGGSEWFRDQSGQESPPGVLTFSVGPDGWNDYQILPGLTDDDV